MKFKKFLALSLAAAMMTTGIPGVGMLDGAVNVMAAEDGTISISGGTIDFGAIVSGSRVDYSTSGDVGAKNNSMDTDLDDDTKWPTYTGKDIVLDDNIVKFGGTTLSEDDYVLTFQKITNAIEDSSSANKLSWSKTELSTLTLGNPTTTIKDAGFYKATIKGVGEYSGEFSTYFRINQADISGYTAKLVDDVVTFTGNNVTPAVTVEDGSGNKLAASKDFQLSYNSTSTNSTAGLYSVTATGTGNYYNTCTVNSSTGSTGKLAVAYEITDVIPYYDGSDLKFDVLVNDERNNSIAHDALTSKATSKINDTPATTINGATDKTTYTVTVEGDSAQATPYTGKVSKMYTVNKDGIDLTRADISVEKVTVNGGVLTPEVTVSLHGRVLDKSAYKVVYSKNKGNDSGSNKEIDIAVYGNGTTYYGKATKSVDTETSSVANTTVDIPKVEYATKSEPKITVTNLSGNALTLSTDYSIEYSAKLTDTQLALLNDADDFQTWANQNYATLGFAAWTNAHGAKNYSSDGIEAGTYIIKVNGTGDYEDFIYKVMTVTPKDISGCAITIGNNAASGDIKEKTNGKVSYTGSDILASLITNNAVIYKSADSNKQISLNDSDVEIKLSNGDDKCTEPGTYAATVKGTGNYQGSVDVQFTVVKSMDSALANFDYVAVDVAEADGKKVYTPSGCVSFNGKVLTEGVDYEIAYYASNGIGATDLQCAYGPAFTTTSTPGNYVAVVTGLGDYDGQIAKKFQVGSSQKNSIAGADITFGSVSSYTAAYTGSPVNVSNVKVKIGNTTLIKGSDYDVVCTNNIDASDSATVTIVGIGSYYGTASKTFTIEPKSVKPLTITPKVGTDTDGKVNYTGSAIKADVMLSDGGKTLDNDKDYTVSYALAKLTNGSVKMNSDGSYETEADVSEIKNVGTYIIKATGIGNYKDVRYTVLQVQKEDLSKFTVTTDDVKQTGKTAEPEFKFVNVTTSDIAEVEADNYDVAFFTDKECKKASDAIEVGTYYAKLTGKNNLKGTKVVKFNVVEGTDISEAKITAIGADEKPELLVVVDGKVLTLDKDYTVEYEVAEDGKTGTATITGTGEYFGTATATYEIKKETVALTKASIKLSKTSYGYNGKAKKPGVTVKVDGVKVDPSEYTVSYSNNKNAGTGKVTITAKDDSEVIKGSKTMTITIAKASNKVTASNVTKSYKVKTLKAKKATFSLSAKAKAGKISYKKLSSGNKITVSSSGKVTVAKGLKKGTYKVKVKVTAASSTNYKAASKTMTVTVKVK